MTSRNGWGPLGLISRKLGMSACAYGWRGSIWTWTVRRLAFECWLIRRRRLMGRGFACSRSSKYPQVLVATPSANRNSGDKFECIVVECAEQCKDVGNEGLVGFLRREVSKSLEPKFPRPSAQFAFVLDTTGPGASHRLEDGGCAVQWGMHYSEHGRCDK